MILPLADALQNTMQNLVSRIAGVNNEELANRGIGMGAAMGYTVKSIAYQFKGENANKTEGTDFISRVANRATTKTEVKPISGVSYEEHSKNVMDNAKPINQTNATDNKVGKMQSVEIPRKESKEEIPKSTNGFKKAFNVGKEVMNLGMYMAEGKNFKTNENNTTNKRMYNRPNINNTRKEDIEENTNKIISIEQDNNND